MAQLLLVDDDLDLTEMLAEFLVLAGHDVHVAHNGREGLARLAERKPDLIVLDVEMPVLGGPGMALEVMLRDCGLEEIPILLLSGAVDLWHIAARVGTPYFLGKPIDPDILIRTLDQALQERRAPQPLV